MISQADGARLMAAKDKVLKAYADRRDAWRLPAKAIEACARHYDAAEREFTELVSRLTERD